MLYGILLGGTFLYMGSQDAMPDGLGNPVVALQTFQKRSTECLIMSNYATAPTSFTIEALLLNVQGEFALRPKTPIGPWLLAGIVTRLAMRMGYHRDPDHYPQISPFQGEMRRRVWASISQLDTLSSYQLGLPSIIQESHCDTRLPRNFLDEDLDSSTTELPAPRSDAELTPISYIIAKGRLLAVFRSFFNHVSTVRMAAYGDIMALDQRLREAHSAIPARLRIVRLEDSITTPPNLLIRRYNLELVFQKSRCILHRHHMTEAYNNPKYAYSRLSCIEAAMTLLGHQAKIYEEVQVGGRLYRDKWFLSSLEHNDFLLAAMIVCLELSSRLKGHPEESGGVTEHGLLTYSRADMVSALQTARVFWTEFSPRSAEALQASTVLGVMLDKVSSPVEWQGSQIPISSLHIHTETAYSEERPAPQTGGLVSIFVYHEGVLADLIPQ